MALNQGVILAANWSTKIKNALVEFFGVTANDVVVTKGVDEAGDTLPNTPLYDAKLLSDGSATFAGRIVGSLDDDNVDVVLKCTKVGNKSLALTTNYTNFKITPKPYEYKVPDIIVIQDLDAFM